jgi:hypothetical protein
VKCFVSLQFLNLRHSVGLPGRVISPLQGRYLTQTQNKHKQTSMPRVGFEPTIPAFERAKTVQALERAAAVIGFGLRKCQQMTKPVLSLYMPRGGEKPTEYRGLSVAQIFSEMKSTSVPLCQPARYSVITSGSKKLPKSCEKDTNSKRLYRDRTSL